MDLYYCFDRIPPQRVRLLFRKVHFERLNVLTTRNMFDYEMASCPTVYDHVPSLFF